VLQAISDELDAGEPLLQVNALAERVLEHTSLQAQALVKHDVNNAAIELDMAKNEISQKLSVLDDYIHKLKVRLHTV